MRYRSNPKHSEPWHAGRKGSICEAAVRPHAQQLLDTSVLLGDKRYAVHEGKAYCGQDEGQDTWHGYPFGWIEVPAKLVRQWVDAGIVRKRDLKTHWEAHQ